MHIRRNLMAGLALIVLLPALTVRAEGASSGGTAKPGKNDDRIHLPYVRLYPSQPEPEKIEGRERMLLKNDDGSMEMPSILSACHAVIFKKPQGNWRVSSVILFLGRIGHAEADEGFKIYICDADRKPLSSVYRAKTRVRLGKPQWYTIPFPSVDVPSEFYVMVDLRRRPDDRSIVYLGCDTAEATAKPMVAEPNGALNYELEQIGTWMIRTVLSGEGNKPEDLVNAQFVHDQELKPATKPGLYAYRAPNTEMKWVESIPKLAPKAGRLELAWDQNVVTVGIRYIGKRGRLIKVPSKSLVVDIPVTEPSVFEVSIMRQGFLPAVKRFTVTPGVTDKWKVELKAQQAERSGSS